MVIANRHLRLQVERIAQGKTLDLHFGGDYCQNFLPPRHLRRLLECHVIKCALCICAPSPAKVKMDNIIPPSELQVELPGDRTPVVERL